MLASQARRFGETLIERHVLSRDDLERALQASEATGEPLPAALLRNGLVGSKDLTAALALSLGIRFVDFQDTTLHQDAPSLVPADVARAHLALAVDFEGNKLVVAFAEPAVTRSSLPLPTAASLRERSSRSTAERPPDQAPAPGPERTARPAEATISRPRSCTSTIS